METTDLLKKVRAIEIKTRKLSDQILSGEYHSSFKGRGMAFSEVRQYQPGDDIRSIDWNVTARKREPYIKVFEEERELTLMLLIDISPSAAFGSRVMQKKQIIIELAATLAFSAMRNNDKVGVVFFTDRIEKYIPPKKGKSHILRIIRELIELKPEGRNTSINKVLEFLAGVLKKKAIVFLLSDFLADDYEKPLKVAAARHDLNGVLVYDEFERELPPLGVIPIVDAETGAQTWVNTSSKKTRTLHKARFLERKERFEDAFSKSGAGGFTLATHEDYARKLLGYFKKR